MLAQMTARELGQWRAYASVEPFGAERDDYRAAIVASTVYNMMRGRKQKALPPSAFMPQYRTTTEDDDDDSRKTPQQLKAKELTIVAFAEALNTAYGGVDLRGQAAGG